MQTFSLLKKLPLLGLLLVMVASCTKEEDTRVKSEPVKSIDGTWKIATVTRNGVDITQYFDFTEFELTFNKNGTYTIANPVPFVVSKGGTWKLDDPAFPVNISFTQEGSTTPFESGFNYPVVGGVRQIVLIGSPGCVKNIYKYSMTRGDL